VVARAATCACTRSAASGVRSFMRSLCGESSFARPESPRAGQQPIERNSQRVRLDRHLRRVDRGKIIGPAAGKIRRDASHRAESALRHHNR